ncbi:Pro-Pol polyprotein [Frankliniella fusca]|uniref:Pro-Pol polyprotein n=1 Tax=Frankliniella fusca TaxID=407009 RepID=A0AAE1HFX2_9NEOP|nr:Pro-Pol polyprotein [Frankliniella fusca]
MSDKNPALEQTLRYFLPGKWKRYYGAVPAVLFWPYSPTHLIVSTCLFSKYVWLRPLRSTKAAHLVRHLEEDIFLKFAVPGTLLTDNGSNYRDSNFMLWHKSIKN